MDAAPDPAGAGPNDPTPPERRTHERFPSGPEVRGTVTLEVQASVVPAEVRNLSRGGVNLVVPRSVPSGKVIVVDLLNIATRYSRRATGRVVYTHPSGDGSSSQVECAFDQALELDEVERLLGKTGTAFPACWDRGNPRGRQGRRPLIARLFGGDGGTDRNSTQRVEILLVVALALFSSTGVLLALYTGLVDRILQRWRKPGR